MSLYNVAIMCVLGVAVNIVLSDHQNASFIIISIFIIFCTTGTLCLVFVPKVNMSFYFFLLLYTILECGEQMNERTHIMVQLFDFVILDGGVLIIPRYFPGSIQITKNIYRQYVQSRYYYVIAHLLATCKDLDMWIEINGPIARLKNISPDTI